MARLNKTFNPAARDRFVEQIGRFREQVTEAARAMPAVSEEQRLNQALISALDDMVEKLTGDRQKFWLKSHSAPIA